MREFSILNQIATVIPLGTMVLSGVIIAMVLTHVLKSRYEFTFTVRWGELFAIKSKREYRLENVLGVTDVYLEWYDPISNLFRGPANPYNEPKFTLALYEWEKIIRTFSNADFRYFEAKRLARSIRSCNRNVRIISYNSNNFLWNIFPFYRNRKRP